MKDWQRRQLDRLAAAHTAGHYHHPKPAGCSDSFELQPMDETTEGRFVARIPKEGDGSRCFDSGHLAVRYAQAQADKLLVPIVVLDRLDGDCWTVNPAPK